MKVGRAISPPTAACRWHGEGRGLGAPPSTGQVCSALAWSDPGGMRDSSSLLSQEDRKPHF